MTTTPTSGAAIQPVLWVSPEQFANFMDADEAQFGRYVPARKTSAGNFTMPLFAAPAQPAAQQGVAYAALPDEGEPWRGHKFKEVQRGCWRCDCGKTIKEVTSDQSTPASGGNYPVMPKRYTVDDDGEELFTAEKMRAFADATHTLRASHGEAPAQPDQPIACSYGDNGYACCEGGPCQADVHNDKLAEQQAPATAQAEESVPAPAPPPECETEAEKRAFAFGWFKALESDRMKADSVQEDAARWRELREQHESDEVLCCVFAPNDTHECLAPVGSLPGELDAFMDSERAARQQGEKQ